jgi:lipoprotein signal peptidase
MVVTMRLMHLPTLRLGLLAAVAAFVADQATKAWALSALWPPYSPGMEVLPVLNLRLGFNMGVTFGMFRDSAAGAAWVLVAVGLLVVAFLGSWLWRTRSGTEALGLGLVIGGALGNILDRLRQGAVTDFLDAHYGGWHWPTFNVADIGIVCGVGLLLISALRPTALDAGHAAPAGRKS